MKSRRAVDVAVFMGAPLIRLFGGGVPEGTENREAVWSTDDLRFPSGLRLRS